MRITEASSHLAPGTLLPGSAQHWAVRSLLLSHSSLRAARCDQAQLCAGAAGPQGCWAALRLSAWYAKVFLPLCSSGWDRCRALLARVWAGGWVEQWGSWQAVRIEQAGKLAAEPCQANFVPLSQRRWDFLCFAFPLAAGLPRGSILFILQFWSGNWLPQTAGCVGARGTGTESGVVA